jgi:hypothetical protein
MNNFFTANYWFNLHPDSLTPLAQKMFIGGLILFIILIIIFGFLKKRSSLYRGLLKSLYAFCWGNFFIGLILFFFSYEQAPFLGARFWLGLWCLAMLAWLIMILKKLKTIPAQKKQREQEEERQKYLP